MGLALQIWDVDNGGVHTSGRK